MKKTTLLALGVAFVGYLFLGGGVFHVLESTHERKIREKTFLFHKEQQEHEEWLFDDDYFKNYTSDDNDSYAFDDYTKQAADDPDHYLTPKEVAELVKRAKINLDLQHKNLTWETPTPEDLGNNNNNNTNATNNTTNRNMIRRKHVPTIVLSQYELEYIIDAVWQASESGLDPFSDETDSSPPHWDFIPATTFSMTVVTTIGYGATTPKTTGGRIFTIFYALLGIPLTAAFLSGLAGVMSDVVRRVTSTIQERHPKCTPSQASHLAWAVCLVLGTGIFFLVPAWVVHHVENWTFLESVYFMFVSLSTIGFGDFVTGNQKELKYWAGYRVLMKIWIVVGLAYLATIFDLISQAIKKVEDKIEEEMEGEETAGEDNLGKDKAETEDLENSDGNKKEQGQQTEEDEAVGGPDPPGVTPRQSGTRRPRVPLIMIVDNPAPAGRQARQHVWQM